MGNVMATPGAATRPPVVTLTGEWDAADERLEDILLGQLRSGDTRLIVDMLNVSFIDSSVVRALVAAHVEANARSGWVRLVYTHHVVRRVIEICGLAEVLPQFGTLDAAARGHERLNIDTLAVEERGAR